MRSSLKLPEKLQHLTNSLLSYEDLKKNRKSWKSPASLSCQLKGFHLDNLHLF